MNLKFTGFVATIIKSITIFANFIVHALIVRALDIQDYASYTKFIQYSSYAALAFNFGFSSSLVVTSTDTSEYFRAVRVISLCYGILMLITISVFGLAGNYIEFIIFPIVIYAIITALQNILLSYYNLQQRYLAQPIVITFNLIVVLVGLLISRNGQIESLSLVIGLYFIGPFLFIFWIVKKHFDWAHFALGNNSKIVKKNILYGSKTLPLMLLGQLVYLTDYILVDLYLSDRDLAIYFAALLFPRLCFSLADALGNIVFSATANSKRIVDNKNIAIREVDQIVTIAFVSAFLAIAVFYVIGEDIVSLIFGNEFNKAYHLSLILLCGMPGMLLYKLLSRKHAAHQNWLPLYKTIIIGVLTNILLCIFLIDIYSLNGVAISTAISYWICGVGLTIAKSKS